MRDKPFTDRKGNLFPALETERLILREPRREDAKELLPFYADPEMMRYTGKLPFKTMQDAEHYVNRMRNRFVHQDGIRWMLEEKASGRYIGDIGFHQLDDRARACNTGYRLGKPFWRQGFMSEAFGAVLAHAFEGMWLEKVFAMVDSRNESSVALLRKWRFEVVDTVYDFEINQIHYDVVWNFCLERNNFSVPPIQRQVVQS